MGEPTQTLPRPAPGDPCAAPRVVASTRGDRGVLQSTDRLLSTAAGPSTSMVGSWDWAAAYFGFSVRLPYSASGPGTYGTAGASCCPA